MAYIPQEVITEVKRMDLLTYLKQREPQELVQHSGNSYKTRTHDSLKISNGKWYWWSEGIGGRSALDYLIKVRGYSFLEAVQILAEEIPTASVLKEISEEKSKEEKVLILPPANRDTDQVISYLQSRGLNLEILKYCVEKELLYESRDYHNVVFVGMDMNHTPRYATVRGTYNNCYQGEASGSDKRYSFSIPARESNRSQYLHLFECAIDLLSFATLMQGEDCDWRKEHLLSLAGVYKQQKEHKQFRMPLALARYLEDYPEIESVILHLDNDRIGRGATKGIMELLKKEYAVYDRPPRIGKDINDMLCIQLGIPVTVKQRSVRER